MTKEQILEIDPDFQQLIDAVLRHNESGVYTYWYEVWGKVVKPMNDLLCVTRWKAKDDRLKSHTAYDSMSAILESLTTLK